MPSPIKNSTIRPASTIATKTPAKAVAPKVATKTPATTGWAPKGKVTTKGVTPAASKWPQPAGEVKTLLDAELDATKAMSQMDMNKGASRVYTASNALLKSVANELSTQLADRGQTAKSAQVLKDLAKFEKQLEAIRPDPKGGSIAQLECMSERTSKIMDQMAKLAAQLETVTAEPAGEYQQAYNRNAGGEAVAAEARLAIAMDKSIGSADNKLIADSLRFFQGLGKRIDSQVDSKGGTLEPLERAGALTEELKSLTAKFAKVKIEN